MFFKIVSNIATPVIYSGILILTTRYIRSYTEYKYDLYDKRLYQNFQIKFDTDLNEFKSKTFKNNLKEFVNKDNIIIFKLILNNEKVIINNENRKFIFSMTVIGIGIAAFFATATNLTTAFLVYISNF